MRHTLFWKEMRELAPVLWILGALELLVCLGFWLLPAGNIPEGSLANLALFAAAAVGVSPFARERRPGTLSLLFSLPVPRGRILAAKVAAGLVSLLLVALGGLATGRLAAALTWVWAPEPAGTAFWWTALSATALLSFLFAARVALDRPEPLLPLAAGGGLGTLVFQVAWVEPATSRGNAMALVAVLCAGGLAAWWLRARFEALEDRAPRWSSGLWIPRPASRRRAPTLLAVEWRQKRALLGFLALLPLLHLVGGNWLAQLPVLSWLGGALAGAALFAGPERDASRFFLHVLPIGRGRLAAGRLLGGLVAGGLYLAECLLVLEAKTAFAGHRSFRAEEAQLNLVIFVFLYGSSFLIGAMLSPWLRSTVVTALLALVSTYLVLLAFAIFGLWTESPAGFWTVLGSLLAVLAAAAVWSTVRSRAFEPAPRKDLLVVLTVFAVWLVIAGILYIP